MQLKEIVAAFESIAPSQYAESWDNVGLLVGDPAREIHRAMFCIDYTPEVACEAAGAECDLIVAYHPPIFSAMKKIVAPSAVFDAIARGVAIYSPHTAWDVADGGSNDVLADIIGITPASRRPLRRVDAKDTHYKLITFVPKDAAEKLSGALFDAGAGHIGDYSKCSFRSAGTGTFLGDAHKTHPSTSQAGKFEAAEEIRLETVVPIAKLEPVLAALRRSHPYETPAFDLVRLAAEPSTLGQGRIGDVPSVDIATVVDRLKNGLAISHLLIAGPMDRLVTRAAVVAGAGGEFLDDAIAQGAGLFVTGEMRHHDALKAATRGVTVICTLHSNSERASLVRLRERLAPLAPNLELLISVNDRDPFTVR